LGGVTLGVSLTICPSQTNWGVGLEDRAAGGGLASTGSMGLWMPSQKTRIRVNRVIISLGNRELLVTVFNFS
jgi:hypothetical protein